MRIQPDKYESGNWVTIADSTEYLTQSETAKAKQAVRILKKAGVRISSNCGGLWVNGEFVSSPRGLVKKIFGK